MARRSDKSGKTGSGQLPAEVFTFPQSSSANDDGLEHDAPPANLSPAERRLYDELLTLARRLDKQGVPGAYGLVANVADQVTALKHRGQSAIAALARGVDALKKADETHTSKRLETMRKVMSDHEPALFTAAICLLIAIGCLIAGFADSRNYFPFSIFALAVTAVFVLPTLWDLKTKR
ncbi:hypothetical protein HYPDE_26678 [Hyphomicrobium denitrificans 1NES1]|uniref:DUF2335 domain-containing protein n=1 Tax=Hyphomicrobium denitrificans 1NES1 TaxID=670307 RepID=N0B929_9HYPH|nr:hypothetical protein [Hyphomicrobium denitrificans]AGK57016.1 hypothetical protein HYPDE_26678 [Hyphomicrobium denitrificans 1NES1]